MWPPIGKIAAHSAYDMFSWYKYLIDSFFFHLGFWSENLFSDCAFSCSLPTCTLLKQLELITGNMHRVLTDIDLEMINI